MENAVKSIKWLDPGKLNPDITFEKIKEVAEPKGPKSISFKNFSYFEYLGILQSLLKFPDVNEEVGADWVVKKTVPQCLHLDKLDQSGFLEVANQVLRDALNKPDETYHLLTSISVSRSFPFKNIVVNDCRLRFFAKRDYPKKYRDRAKVIKSVNPLLKCEHDNYLKCIVTVTARYPAAAAHKALAALDYLRSTICLSGNPRVEFNWGPSSDKPMNIVRLGQAHTLHDKNGKALTDNVWYEPNFYEHSVDLTKNANHYRELFGKIDATFSDSTFGKKLIESLIRYARAGDEKDANTGFLKLWSVMETVLSPGDARHEKVVQRGAALFADTDRKFHQQALNHLRLFRNRSVHDGEESNQAKAYCFQLQKYFKQLMTFHLHMFASFHSLDQANEFLDLPMGKTQLEDKIAMYQRALKLRYGEDTDRI